MRESAKLTAMAPRELPFRGPGEISQIRNSEEAEKKPKRDYLFNHEWRNWAVADIRKIAQREAASIRIQIYFSSRRSFRLEDHEDEDPGALLPMCSSFIGTIRCPPRGGSGCPDAKLLPGERLIRLWRPPWRQMRPESAYFRPVGLVEGWGHPNSMGNLPGGYSRPNSKASHLTV